MLYCTFMLSPFDSSSLFDVRIFDGRACSVDLFAVIIFICPKGMPDCRMMGNVCVCVCVDITVMVKAMNLKEMGAISFLGKTRPTINVCLEQKGDSQKRGEKWYCKSFINFAVLYSISCFFVQLLHNLNEERDREREGNGQQIPLLCGAFLTWSFL